MHSVAQAKQMWMYSVLIISEIVTIKPNTKEDDMVAVIGRIRQIIPSTKLLLGSW